MTEEASKPAARPDLVHEVNLRVSFKLLVPVVAVVEVLAVIALFATLLYSLPEGATTWASVATGTAILAATALVSRHKTFTKAILGEMALLTIYPLAIAVVLVNLA